MSFFSVDLIAKIGAHNLSDSDEQDSVLVYRHGIHVVSPWTQSLYIPVLSVSLLVRVINCHISIYVSVVHWKGGDTTNYY